ncbi:hypothetical protein DDR33_03455 [Pararcticibacter amylolyticus]|uniref:Uncharacterized protein n=2 Tax=Pararcticibacter amylolyticus TaxID=2173175 RepID=A0A2U2PKZ8_9SPHI|nr:hypothetical protein DDR33_03455 [Pararcticibacter amylolyticus]
MLYFKNKKPMNIQDGNQWNEPTNEPKGKGPEPRQQHDGNEDAIRKGARQEDQLDSLKPEKEEDKAPNQAGSPPLGSIDQGNK